MNIMNLKRLGGYLASYKIDLSIVMISLCCVSAALLILGQILKRLIDNGLGTSQFLIVNQEILTICLVILIFGISSFFRSYNINNITAKVTNQIRLDAFNKLINREVVYFEAENINHIVSKLTLDIELLAKLITNLLSFFIRNFIMLLGALVLMFMQSYKLAAIVTLSVPLILLPLLKIGKLVKFSTKRAAESQDNLLSILAESLTHIRVIHSFNQQSNRISVFKDSTKQYLHITANKIKTRSIFFSSAISVVLLSITFVIWIGSKDILLGNISAGKMLSFIYYAILAGSSAGGIAEVISEIQSPLLALERILLLIDDDNLVIQENKFLLKPKLLMNIDNVFALNSAVQLVEFRNVSFCYPTRPTISSIKNVSFSFNCPSFIGIIGPSGAGKSTIAQLMLKFYHPDSGSILINNTDISQIDTNSLRSMIAYVPQEPSMFLGTIRHNILLSKPDASKEEIDLVADISGVSTFTNSFEHKLDTEIGQFGVKLSGGQKQRIAIARALLFKPQILILDEATSSIDSESEQKILSQIKLLMANKMVISIAHRISSLSYADQIIIIDNGVVTACGNQEYLANMSNFYSNLLNNKDHN
ncbi:MAG: ATP-binding cassette domain-containing protein [Rickettsiaceae bacterium]|nr:MAG: ATP-binding cassette domain-containing protein [Rickettsiaceae bacterium]